MVYTSFTKAVSHRWTYVQRTVPEIAEIDNLFVSLLETISEKLIPSLIGRKVSDSERRIPALPVRYDDLVVRDPINTSKEFLASPKVTEIPSQIIVRQERDFRNYDQD